MLYLPTQVGIWQVLFLGRSAEEAWEPLQALPPVEYFRDASCGPSMLPLTIMDVIQARHLYTLCPQTLDPAETLDISYQGHWT